jgi:uncharacterized protein (TIGR03032 family)
VTALLASSSPPAQRDSEAFRYVHSTNFPAILERLNATLMVSTYQLGKLALFRARHEKLTMLLRTFDKAMGLAVDRDRLAIGTTNSIWFLRNDPATAADLDPPGRHDACYLPRSCHVTGDISVHEMAWGRDWQEVSDDPIRSRRERATLWFVNTKFSCLCTLDPDFSFVPRWKPNFVTRLAPEDCCHLNGLALQDGQPKYVTVLAQTDTPQGWRAYKRDGGCLIDVPSGEVVASGLAMPHSPRLYRDRIWLLDSGTGRLMTVDERSGSVETVAELPGFTRGLTFCGDYAFVGLSQIRETSTFGGLPIVERLSAEERKCGVWVVQLSTGAVVAFLEFERRVQEIFDVQLLAGIRCPAVIGLQKDDVNHRYVIPEFVR